MKYIIEHMEEGFSEWVTLEYMQILKDVKPGNLILTSLPEGTTDENIPKQLKELGLRWTTRNLTEIPHLSPNEYEPLSAGRVCLLDPRAEIDLQPTDRTQFDYFVFGGILGDHPPRDRTKELQNTYPDLLVGRRLGDKQMTTDTAVRTTQIIIEGQKPFEDIQFIDYPEFRFSKTEATEMPFRYVLGSDGKPILPSGMLELIKKDSQQSLDDLLM